MQLPNLLIIGAMKAGTTSFYMDLTEHPLVYRAEDKEPHSLCNEDVLSERGMKSYAEHYAGAESQQIIIDASTGYAKLPDSAGVADRAAETLGDDFKVVYIVRNPIKRIISHHHHDYTAGTAGRDINREVRDHPRYLNFSRYAFQLGPWVKAVGKSRILVIQFEDYVANREESLEKVCNFLGLDASLFPKSEEKIYNKTTGKPVRNRFWDIVFHSGLYRRIVRQVLSPRLRLTLMEWLLPKGSVQPEEPSPETIRWMIESLSDDVRELQEMLGIASPAWEEFSTCVGPPSGVTIAT